MYLVLGNFICVDVVATGLFVVCCVYVGVSLLGLLIVVLL